MNILQKTVSMVIVLSVVLFFGCQKPALREGTYNGSAVDMFGGKENTATAKIVVDNKGKIVSVYLDSTYEGSTKKTLGFDYMMKKSNPAVAGEWFEQIEKLEKEIVAKQGISFVKLDSDGKTDAVSGCTVVIRPLVEAASKAIEQAK